MGEAALFRSIFGTGYFVTCTSEPWQPPKTAVVCKVVMLQTKLPDFLTTEAFGIEPHRLCPGYKGC
ncbi:MAG: hypothetical protein GY696_03075 [Gammaproteobacteria bacterium]|nr:hypothetical protein [Gammaproteobacteria bacterium]